MTLADEKCVPCEGSTLPLSLKQAQAYSSQVPEWSLSESGRTISRTFRLNDFVAAMEFANRITPLAEHEGHHPDLFIGWGKVKVELSTHSIGGLSVNDFILAAKIDRIAPSEKKKS